VGLIALVGLVSWFYLFTIQLTAVIPPASDFPKFYASSRLFWENKPIYTPAPIDAFWYVEDPARFEKNILSPNLNPPFHILLLAPLGRLDYATAFWIWSLLSLVCGIGAVFLFPEALAGNRISLDVILLRVLLLLAFYPTWAKIWFAQTSLLLLLAVVVGWVGGRRGKDRVAGIALGLALSVKPFIGLFVVPLLLWRRWRLLFWLALTFSLCSLLALAVLGLNAYLDYLAVLRTVTWYSANWNESFMGFFSRVVGGMMDTPPGVSNWLAQVLTLVASTVTCIALVWTISRRANGRLMARFDLGFSMTIVAMLLISPLGWIYYFPLLLIPFVVCWTLDLVQAFRYRLVTIIIAWTLVNIPTRYVPPAETNTPEKWFLWGGVHFYGLLVLMSVILAIAFSEPARDE
jgi:hypothetical protein